jgi:hypothetical protein
MSGHSSVKWDESYTETFVNCITDVVLNLTLMQRLLVTFSTSEYKINISIKNDMN